MNDMSRRQQPEPADVVPAKPLQTWFGRTIFNNFIAKYSKVALELKLLNIVLGFGVTLAVVTAVSNALLGLNFVMVAACMISGLFFVGFYYLANVKKKYKLSVFLLTTASVYVLVPVIWIFNAGTLGGNAVYIILLSSIIVTLCRGVGRLAAIGSLISITSVLMLMEYIYPDMIIGYESNIARFQDIYIAVISAVVANALLFMVVLNEYNKERLNLEKIQSELLYLSYHDALTGIYNRTYFEIELKTSKYADDRGTGVIVADVDNLKFINDTFGHTEGDKLLIRAAQCLKNASGNCATICRIGGDEFVILLHKVTNIYIEELYKSIRDSLQSENMSLPMDSTFLQMSVGYAYSAEAGISIEELFQKADNKMYREKLSRHAGEKGSIVHAIQQMLLARDVGTGDHVNRVKRLSVDFARAIGIPEYEMADLQLFAEFHDVGKIGVPDHILNKPGPLTVVERAQMEKHSEIGQRIAQSSQELRPIAQWILEHHEWWNGKGYPLGITGDTISLACRILAIVDAYDAMISDRPYRPAMSKTQAMDELLLFAGSQFDPVLVPQFVSFIGCKLTGSESNGGRSDAGSDY